MSRQNKHIKTQIALTRLISLFTLLISLFLSLPHLSAQRYQVGDTVQNFTLTNRATGQPVSLSDFEGKIVFLEWFAYWCPFCQSAADQVQTGIVDYYDTRQGNPTGIPVLHVSLNLQADAETLTQGFVNTYGLELVLNDFDRSIASKFQASNQPIFAIINGVANSPSHAQWELLYTSLGYLQNVHPITTFRQAIDSVQAAPALALPTISTPPHATRLATGDALELSVQATGEELSYKWYRDDTLLADQKAATLSIPNAGTEHSGSYAVTIRNPAGEITSVPVQATVLLSFADYLAAANLTAPDTNPDADPDRDGHSNIFEYIAQTDPTDVISTPDTTLTAYSTPQGVLLELRFTPNPNSIGYTVSIETSSSPDFTQITAIEPAEVTSGVEGTIILPPATPAIFARLKAIKN